MKGMISIVKENYPELDNKIKYDVRIATGKFDFTVCTKNTLEEAEKFIKDLKDGFSESKYFESRKEHDRISDKLEK